MLRERAAALSEELNGVKTALEGARKRYEDERSSLCKARDEESARADAARVDAQEAGKRARDEVREAMGAYETRQRQLREECSRLRHRNDTLTAQLAAVVRDSSETEGAASEAIRGLEEARGTIAALRREADEQRRRAGSLLQGRAEDERSQAVSRAQAGRWRAEAGRRLKMASDAARAAADTCDWYGMVWQAATRGGVRMPGGAPPPEELQSRAAGVQSDVAAASGGNRDGTGDGTDGEGGSSWAMAAIEDAFKPLMAAGERRRAGAALASDSGAYGKQQEAGGPSSSAAAKESTDDLLARLTRRRETSGGMKRAMPHKAGAGASGTRGVSGVGGALALPAPRDIAELSDGNRRRDARQEDEARAISGAFHGQAVER